MSVDSTDGTDRLTNIITYHYLIQHGVIKEGWQGREFINGIEDMMMRKTKVEFTSKPSTVQAFITYTITDKIPVAMVMAAASAVSECISYAKTGSNKQKAVNLVARLWT